MKTRTIRTILGVSLLAAAAGTATMAQAEQVWARVISATPSPESTGNIAYNVTYEYNGRQYTTRTDTRPGSSIAIDVGGYGVATTQPVAPQSPLRSAPVYSAQAASPTYGAQPYNSQPQGSQPDWNNVVPEPGVVVGAGGPPPVYGPAPVYVQPAPVYYPAPVYVQPAYGYPSPYVYPPIGLSLNLGYSRGWGGGHGRWR